jgi:hypothetical protein
MSGEFRLLPSTLEFCYKNFFSIRKTRLEKNYFVALILQIKQEQAFALWLSEALKL